MKVNFHNLLAYLAKSLNLEEGRYTISYKSTRLIIGMFSVDKDFNVTAEGCTDKELVSAFTSDYTVIKKIKPAPEKYFFITNDLTVVEKEDEDDSVDKTNKANKNYFPCKEFTRNAIIDQFRQHIIDMKLNLLANFYPSME